MNEKTLEHYDKELRDLETLFVEIEDYQPTKFSELISYKKTSITPLDAFIAKDMTSVLDVVEHGTGTIPANFRIIPENSVEKAKDIIKIKRTLEIEEE